MLFTSHPLLELILFPLLTCFFVAILPNSREKEMNQIALFGSWFTWLASLHLFLGFDKGYSQYQFVKSYSLISTWNIPLTLGVDGISIFLVLLTTFLIPLCLMTGWNTIKKKKKEYILFFLGMESLLLLVFMVMDLLLFYIFFESVLIPMYFIIGIWGSRERKMLAAYQFFLYTLVGSLVMLLAILWIYIQVGTTDYITLTQVQWAENTQKWLWLAFFASFAVKVPMIPVHIWLPEAHVEAPTSGSVILAGILLKLGTYGMLRYLLVLFPYACIYFTPLVYTMSLIAIIYASLTTIRQIDMKKIIAYSSVAHMNFVTIGMFALNLQGIEGSIMLMLSHGLVSSALFLSIGVLYDRFHTRLLPYYGGIALFMPVYTVFFLFFTFANMSFPGTASFVGELLILLGIFQENIFVAFIASIGVILGAVYSIWLANRVLFGPYNKYLGEIRTSIDLTRREMAIMSPLVLGTLVMGIYPEIFLDTIHSSSIYLIQHIQSHF